MIETETGISIGAADTIGVGTIIAVIDTIEIETGIGTEIGIRRGRGRETEIK